MAHPIYVIGVGPGTEGYLLPVARRAAEECTLLVGSRRALETFAHLPAAKYELGNDLATATEVIAAGARNGTVGVLVSGDPGLYSILNYLLGHFPRESLRVIPGISSMQVAFARLKLPWHDARIVSLHGRDRQALLPAVKAHGKVGVFTDQAFPPAAIAAHLLAHGVTGRRMAVCRDLSYDTEYVVEGSLAEIAAGAEAGGRCVVIIYDA